MKPKKNPKANLSKWSMIFTQIGLIIALFVSWQTINWKTYDKSNLDLAKVDMNALLDEDVPITQRPNTPPPPPPPPPPPVKTPEILEVVENEEDVEEVVIQSSESDQDDIIKIEEVQDVAPTEEIKEVPFMVIENPPIFPGCEKYDSKEERKECMSKKITEFVMDEFDSDIASELGLPSGLNRITVLFKIDVTGKIVNVRAVAAHPRLAREAEDIVKRLPQMKPGEQRGKKVIVSYSLPILFKVQ